MIFELKIRFKPSLIQKCYQTRTWREEFPLDTHPVLVPASSLWLCTPGGTEGRRRWVTGNWPGSSWILLILAPRAALSLVCVQADCQAAFHRIPQVGEGWGLRGFSRLWSWQGRDRMSLHTRVLPSVGHPVLQSQLEKQELLSLDWAAALAELQTWHMVNL